MEANQSEFQRNFHSFEISVSNERFSYIKKLLGGYF